MTELITSHDSQHHRLSDTDTDFDDLPLLLSPEKRKSDVEESPAKKRKSAAATTRARLLEDRISSILSCCICLDLSSSPMFQCVNGHLMCASCFNHLIADCKLKDEQTTCPNCRCEISKSTCARNLAVEKTISELPIQCDYCFQTLSRAELDSHQSHSCLDRPVNCDYSLLGCEWNGPFNKLSSHLGQCEYPTKTGSKLIETIRAQKGLCDKERQGVETVVDLLSLNQIGVSDLILKPYRTDDFAAKLYFETSRFTALQYQWQVRIRINDNTPHPHTTVTRTLSYQLVLKSKANQSVDMKFFILKGPHGDPATGPIQPIIYHFEFNSNNLETEYLKLPIDSQECNKMLSSPSISFRLFMIQLDKS